MAKINNLNKNFLPFGINASSVDRKPIGSATDSNTLDLNINNDYFTGWRSVSNENDPVQMFDMNGAMYGTTAMLQYQKQRGISEWVTTQEMYYPCMVFGSDGHIYAGKQDGFDFTKDPTTDGGTNWVRIVDKNGPNLTGYSRIYTASNLTNIVLTAIPQQSNPTAYYDGMIVEFIAIGTNGAGVTLNVNGLGNIPLKNQDGSPIFNGTFVAGDLVKAYKDGSIFKYIDTRFDKNPTGTIIMTNSFTNATTPLGYIPFFDYEADIVTFQKLYDTYVASGVSYGTATAGKFIVGAKQGDFLRVTGGNAGSAGLHQDDAIRDIQGQLNIGNDGGTGSVRDGNGVFLKGGPTAFRSNGGVGSSDNSLIGSFVASRVVPVATENRPVNTAFRFFIKYK